MVDALTCLSCCAGRRISFLCSAMTGRRPLLANMQYFLVLMNLFLFLSSVLLKDEHLYFILLLQPCKPIGGNKDQMIVRRIGL